MNQIGRVMRVATIAAVCAGLSSVAYAADLPISRPAPIPASVVNWTGFYLGGGIAGMFNGTDYKRPGQGLSDISIGSIDPHSAFAAYAGFNYQVAPWAVLGIEGKGTFTTTAHYREFGTQFDFLQNTSRVVSVTGRAGLTIRPDTMFYGKVGPAWIETEGFQNFGDVFHKDLLGVQGGFGIETMIAPNLSVRAETSYTYATQQLSLNQNTQVYRPTVLTADLGLTYKFDAPTGWGMPAGIAVAPTAVANLFTKAKAKPSEPVARSWTGFEVGGFVSANGNQMQFNDTLLTETGPYTSVNVGGGWFVGANYQYQRMVVGIDASVNYEQAVFQTATGSGGLAVNHYNFAKVDQALALTGRIGWLATPDTLFYAKGGVSQLRTTPNDMYFNAVSTNITFPHTLAGYQAGFGAETFVTSNVSLRAEGLYTYTPQVIILNGTVPSEYRIKPYLLSGTVGAALHF